MAVEGTKIREMMEGKTLEKDNIKKMYDMVQNASEPEDKKKVMKHSVFFIGQLPLKENHIVDLEQTRRIVNGSVPFSEVDTYMDYLLKGLSTQKLLLEKEDGSYEVNTKYEKSVIKVRKIRGRNSKSKKDVSDGNKILSFRSVRGGSGLLYECGGISRVPHGIL